MMMTASAHQLRPAPIQWLVEAAAAAWAAYSGEGLGGRDQQLHDDGCGHA